MKTSTLIFLCLLGMLAIFELTQAQAPKLCDDFDCSMDCYEHGRHGLCQDDICTCQQCIYRACRRVCMQRGQVGQCDEAHCVCL